MCIYFKKNRADLDGGVYDVYTGKVVTKYTIVTQVYTYDPINTLILSPDLKFKVFPFISN